MSRPTSTDDYRQYPKGPNFGLIVGVASVILLVILAVALFVLHGRSGTLMPHKPNPQPNATLILSASAPATDLA